MYIGLFILLFLLYLVLHKIPDQDRAKRTFIYIFTLVLCFGSALRHMGVGNDTYAYFLNYEEIESLPWNQVIQSVQEFYSGSHLNAIQKDPGYTLFVKTIQTISPSFEVYLFLIALLFTSAIGYIVYKNIHTLFGYIIAYSFYISLFYHFLPNSAIRQTIAMGIALWGLIIFINKNRFLLPCLMIYIASTIHKSSIIGFLPLLLFLIQRPKTIFKLALIIGPLLYITGRSVASFLAEMSDVDDYMLYATSSFYKTAEQPIMFIIQIILLYLLGLYTIGQKDLKERNEQFVYICFSIACYLVSFILIDPTLIRLIAYFSIWGVAYVPNLPSQYSSNFRAALWIILLVLTMGRSLISPPPYKFYWQEMQLHERYG